MSRCSRQTRPRRHGNRAAPGRRCGAGPLICTVRVLTGHPRISSRNFNRLVRLLLCTCCFKWNNCQGLDSGKKNPKGANPGNENTAGVGDPRNNAEQKQLEILGSSDVMEGEGVDADVRAATGGGDLAGGPSGSMVVERAGSGGTGERAGSGGTGERGEAAGGAGERGEAAGTRAVLQQNRQFLDFFWDIAKPEQEVRLRGIRGLLEYLRSSEGDELQYAIKRLIEGLAATRETARPGFSLALAQVLQFNEEISLQTILEQIKMKHDITKTKKKLIRNAAFGNLFGVLALSQSGRLLKDPDVLLESVRLLQSLSQYKQHLRDLPGKTIVDILSETPEDIFKKVLFGALKADMSSAFSSPSQLHLLLVALQRFPNVLKPQNLKTLLGSSTILSPGNIPKLIELLKVAAKSVKKDQTLPPLALDLVRVALREGTFDTFWKELVENGLLKDRSGPTSYLCFRLLGNTLPLLNLCQLNLVLTGEVMRHYGDHVVSAQLPKRFRFAPEMEKCVDSFLESTQDGIKQFTVIKGFSCLTNNGHPIIPSYWKVVCHLQSSVLLKYVDWLKSMFVSPDLDSCIDFSTKRQKENQQPADQAQHSVKRLRMWIVARLISIVENGQVKKEEDLVMDIARFIFFHGFFGTKHYTPDIPETEVKLTVPLDDNTRDMIANSFFGLLNHLNSLPPLGDSAELGDRNEKRVLGVTADGNLWIYCLVQYASVLLSQERFVRAIKPFTQKQREAWDRMLQSVENLQKKSKTAQKPEASAFQLLFLLVGIQLFQVGEDSLDLLSDLHKCLEEWERKKMKKRSKHVTKKEEPEWVEVVVEILLSFLSQPSRLMRQVSKMVFMRICPHVTKEALQLILDVFKPESEEDESAVIVTEEFERPQTKVDCSHEDEMESESGSDESEEEEDNDGDDTADDSDEDQSGSEEEGEEEETVDENFRTELMKVLQAANVMSKEGESSSDEEVDDETMMALDKNIAALFSERKKRLQAAKDEKGKMVKEKTLRKNFKIKVLDLIEIFLAKQPENPLVFDIIEPLIAIIEESLSSHSNQQEQDYLRKAAEIFKNQLCKAKSYCQDISDVKENLHKLMEQLVTRASKQADSSVSLYCFSGALYLFRVLKGKAIKPAITGMSEEEEKTETGQVDSFGSLDINRVTELYQGALTLFMNRRKSSLTGSMFVDLFSRFPVMCCRLLPLAIVSITDGVREHQRGQACCLVLKALQSLEVKQSFSGSKWNKLITEVISQVKQCLKTVTSVKLKVEQEEVRKCLELAHFLLKTVTQQKLDVSVAELIPVLQSLEQLEDFGKVSQLYWHVMKLLGFNQPKKEKVKPQLPSPVAAEGALKKKKGFLPETKKRKNWKKKKIPTQESEQTGKGNAAGKLDDVPKATGDSVGKKRNKKKRKKNPGGKATSNPGTNQEPPAKKPKKKSDRSEP
ncbi:myb-binding protein 1A-like protein [Pristis pectinata]|uniref:myb-binding protein 1A-like protein n=1 Tax=Pristis pectinata TaxID=685728 RepID=UPI00223D53AD|nr:myb-binding protein 1A-like protein [Pristis pectinata]